MALFRWRGVVSSAWDSGLNWVDGAGAAYAVGRYPGSLALNYDDVLFDNALAVGANSVAGGNYSAHVGLQSFLVGPDYDGSIGSNGAPLIIHHSNLAVDPRMVIDGKLSTGMWLGVIVAQSLYDIRVLNGTVVFSGAGTLDGMICLKGNITISTGGLILDTLFHVGYLDAQNDVTLTIASDVVFSCQPAVSGGNTICGASNAVGMQMYNGYWVQNAAASLIDVYNGTFVWNAGTLTTLRVFGGLVDGSESQIGRNLDGATVYENGTLDLDNGMGNIVIVNGITTVDGTVNWFPGTQLQPYP
jgi:hypothetical protein